MAKVTSKLPSALRASTLVVLGAAAVELTLYFRFDTKPSFFLLIFLYFFLSLLFLVFSFLYFFFVFFFVLLYSCMCLNAALAA